MYVDLVTLLIVRFKCINAIDSISASNLCAPIYGAHRFGTIIL